MSVKICPGYLGPQVHPGKMGTLGFLGQWVSMVLRDPKGLLDPKGSLGRYPYPGGHGEGLLTPSLLVVTATLRS